MAQVHIEHRVLKENCVTQPIEKKADEGFQGDLFANGSHRDIFGRPGSGKSVLVSELLLKKLKEVGGDA